MFWSVAGALTIYMVLAWFAGTWLHLEGARLWILRGGLAIIGVLAAAVFLWFDRKSQSEPAITEVESDSATDIDQLILEADNHLRNSKLGHGLHLRNLPLIFLIGDLGTTKTTTVVHSGIEPELLAGHVFQGNAVVPTRLANIWFAHGTILVEAAGSLLSDAARWAHLVRRLQPGKMASIANKAGQAPRAVVVFFDCENFLHQGAADLVANAARNLRSRLREISQALGISFPIYVLFAKVDRIPFFAEYVRNLTHEEITQVLGVTLPLDAGVGAGTYAENEDHRLSRVFDSLFYSLSDHRPDFLHRENDHDKRPSIYEFPREFRKIRKLLVQFLVELARPSQLGTNPFLRGFYFSGVRAVLLNDAPAIAVGQSTSHSEPDATRIFQFSRGAIQARESVSPNPALSARKVPEWTFVEHLFNEILLRDRAAMGTSAVSTKISYWRRALLAMATLVSLLACIALGVSYYFNWKLENQVVNAGLAISSNAELLSTQLPTSDQLQKLDRLRGALQTLSEYKSKGAPWYMRCGLFVGDRLYPPARSVYFADFYNLLFAQTQGRLLAALQSVPTPPGPNDDYGRTYDDLKAYLITTSNHDKSTRLFLPSVLIRRWGEGRTIDPERVQLADNQFEYYAEELKLANPYSSENDSLAVERARAYLAKFGGTERTYKSIIEEASQANPAVYFSQRFPGAESVLVAPQGVEGAYTKQGWSWVQNAIQNNLNRFYRGEIWVLGNQADNLADERIRVQDELRARYLADFSNQWRNMLKSAGIVRYTGLKDAAEKLRILSGNQSPLLELLWLVSGHTTASPEIASVFQPVHTIMPPAQAEQTDRYIGQSNQSYMNALVGVQTSVEAIIDPAVDKQAVDQSISSSVSALRVTAELSNTFRIDSEGHVETTVRTLMEEPITALDSILRSSSAGALNGKGQGLCSSWNRLAASYPFNPRSSAQASIQDVNAIFQPQGGALWSFYASTLSNYIVRDGAQFKANPNGGVRINPAFLAFLNKASRFTDTLYSGSSQPHVSFTMRARSTEGMDGVTLDIDGQTLTGSSSMQFLWPGSGPQEVKLTGRLPGGSELLLQDFQGPWAVFQFLGEADHRVSSGSTETLEWIAKTGGGGQPMRLPDGRRVTVSFDLSAGSAAPLFTKGFFSGLRCVPTIAQK